VGLNLIPRRDGYVEESIIRMVVDDVEPVLERMKRKHKNAAIVKRPSARPFAAYSGHDPDGNVFDLAQKKEDTRKEVYAEIAGGGWAQDRYINKFAIRTPNAEECANSIARCSKLEREPQVGTAGYCLTDGRVTLAVLPGRFRCSRACRSSARVRPYRLSCRESGRVQGAGRGSGRMNPYSPGCRSRQPGIRCAQRFFAGQASGKWQMSDPDGTGSTSPTIELAIASRSGYAIGKQNDLAPKKRIPC